MKIIRNALTIVSEIVILVLATLWYLKSYDYEPLIIIITCTIGLIASLLNRKFTRPKIILHKQKTDWGRNSKGYTSNNPPIIRVGKDNTDQYWELNWNYVLEIRNNSSETAYYIEIEYQNLPPKTFVNGEIGKIEPITPYESRVLKIKLYQNITGSYIDADKYLESNADIISKILLIKIKYKDESGTTFYTFYNWVKDENKLKFW